ncbi:MAG: type II secretion system protein [Firmicutes bacterium]|nr:type II secretion system protein [Bacillota bacterium]
MRKLGKKGFTLIELLAVIVIMGILMLVAVPAAQRYIVNSKKDTMVSQVKQYVEAVRKAYVADEFNCGSNNTEYGTYYFYLSDINPKLEDIPKSPFTKQQYGGTYGAVRMTVDDGKIIQIFVSIYDTNGNGIKNTLYQNIARSSVSDSVTYAQSVGSTITGTKCTLTN